MKKILIVGAGQAGISCATHLRAAGFDGVISLIGDEPHVPYQRPPLSKAYMLGKTESHHLDLCSEKSLAENRIDLVTETRISTIDPSANSVIPEKGKALEYDRLVLATGSRARRLPDSLGMSLQGVHTLRTIEDADTLRRLASTISRALVIGGGYIGLEVAASYRSLGVDVTVVEQENRVLNRVAGAEIATAITAAHREHGVTIMTGIGIKALEGEKGVFKRARLTDGSVVEADMVLVGIGGVANDELAGQAGLETRNGIVVDAACRTANSAIYAAGDCARFPFRGHEVRLESVQNAVDQGAFVAKAIMGQAERYDPVPWFWSDQYDLKLQTAGLAVDYDRTVQGQSTRAGSTVVWYLRDAKVIAADTINDAKTHMSVRRIFAAGGEIRDTDLADASFDLVGRAREAAA